MPQSLVGNQVRCPLCDIVFVAEGASPESPAPGSPSATRPTLETRVSRSRRPHWAPEDVDFDDLADDARGRAVRRWATFRRDARRRVQGPAALLIGVGILVSLVGLLAFGGLAVAASGAAGWNNPWDEEAIFLAVMGGVAALAAFVLGPIMILGGQRMRQLRSYSLAMTATVLVFVTGFLVCTPLALAGIWPLVVLLNADVRLAFQFKDGELPDA